MVKYLEIKTVFQFDWNQVVQAFWKRYPNPESKHVLSEDTFYREVKDNKLFSKRILTKTNRPPKWGEKFVSARIVKIVEESIVDPKEKVLTTYTRNIGYTSLMSVVEKVVYKVSDENPNWTVAERSAWVDSHVYGFARAIQAFGIDRFRKNCQKQVNGFNYVLFKMFRPVNMTNPDELTSQSTSSSGKEKLIDAAKKASDLAKAKAGTMYASCQTSQT
uniref:PRELI/MSF1 domain-containing protein n=1 Tax=Clastoptera arizonana TaxID=38151 RepID=A0A1B6E3G8_9HEMI